MERITYRCNRPAGHDGACGRFTERDHAMQVPGWTWCRVMAEPVIPEWRRRAAVDTARYGRVAVRAEWMVGR